MAPGPIRKVGPVNIVGLVKLPSGFHQAEAAQERKKFINVAKKRKGKKVVGLLEIFDEKLFTQILRLLSPQPMGCPDHLTIRALRLMPV